jgi:hypothetical protein
MNTTISQDSAKIYQFPPGGRASLRGPQRDERGAKPSAPTVQPSVCSGSWYHEEAIQEAKPAWDR